MLFFPVLLFLICVSLGKLVNLSMIEGIKILNRFLQLYVLCDTQCLTQVFVSYTTIYSFIDPSINPSFQLAFAS